MVVMTDLYLLLFRRASPARTVTCLIIYMLDPPTATPGDTVCLRSSVFSVQAQS